MEEEGVKLEHFKLPTMPELAMSGSQRELLLAPKGLKVIEIIKDEFNEGKLAAKIAFELPSGAFATTVLAEIMKVESTEE
jgi:tRNA(Glu) U13 pseudouridine synthase TruD